MNNTHLPASRSPTFFGAGIRFMVRFFGWFFFSVVGCIGVSVMMVVLEGNTGFNLLHHRMLTDYSAVGSLSWVGLLPDAIREPTVSLPIMTRHPEIILWRYWFPYVQSVLIGAKLLLIHLYVCWRSLPLFLLLGSVGLIDGLTQRAIRRMNVGRESALLYHHTKSLIGFIFLFGTFLDLTLPISVASAKWVEVSAALAFAFAMGQTAKRFKKYL